MTRGSTSRLHLRRRLILISVLGSFLAAPKAWGADGVQIRGNVALPSEVYFMVLKLSGIDTAVRVPAWSSKARRIEELLGRFLRGSGYDLATVSTHTDDGILVVDVDEGRLDKVIFVDQGAVRAIEMRIGLDLPGRVFNRPLVERHLAELKETFRAERVRYQVVPVAESKHAQFQIDDAGLLSGLQLVRPGEPHELRIYVEYSASRTGLELGLALGPPDGIRVEGRERLANVIMTNDEGSVGARLGFRPTEGLKISERRVLSRATLFGEWTSAPLWSRWLRGVLAMESDLLGRTRPALGLLHYYFFPSRISFGFEMKLGAHLSMTLDGGGEHVMVFDTIPDLPTDSPLLLTTKGHFRPFVRGRTGYVFNPKELRKDRHNGLLVGGRWVGPGTDGSKASGSTWADVRATFPLGWDELNLGLHGGWVAAAAPFYDHLALGDGFLRLAFSDVYTTKTAAVNIEYRFSLIRDMLKVGVFTDAAVAGDIPPETGAFFFDSFGLGVHLLFLDMFQLSAYGGVGVSSHEEGADYGFTLWIQQVF